MPTASHGAINAAANGPAIVSAPNGYTNDTGSNPASGGMQPSGAGYVPYSSLSGTNFYTKAATVGSTSMMAMPVGTLTLPGFPNSSKVTTCGGYVGAGSAKTILSQAPISSSGATVPTAKGTTNPNWLLVAQTDDLLLSDFSMRGTSQSLDPYSTYNGLDIYRSNDPVVSRVKLVSASPGNDKQPPGETFGISMYGCTGGTFTDVEIDGSATANNTAGASLFATNSQAGAVEYTRCYAHNGGYSAGWAFWQTIGSVTLTDCVVDGCRCYWNVERCGGTITLIRPRIGALRAATDGWDPINAPNKSSAVGIFCEAGAVYTSQADAQNFRFIVQDPCNLDESPYDGPRITVQIASAYDNSGNKITQYYSRTNFEAYDSGGVNIAAFFYNFL